MKQQPARSLLPGPISSIQTLGRSVCPYTYVGSCHRKLNAAQPRPSLSSPPCPPAVHGDAKPAHPTLDVIRAGACMYVGYTYDQAHGHRQQYVRQQHLQVTQHHPRQRGRIVSPPGGEHKRHEQQQRYLNRLSNPLSPPPRRYCCLSPLPPATRELKPSVHTPPLAPAFVQTAALTGADHHGRGRR